MDRLEGLKREAWIVIDQRGCIAVNGGGGGGCPDNSGREKEPSFVERLDLMAVPPSQSGIGRAGLHGANWYHTT